MKIHPITLMPVHAVVLAGDDVCFDAQPLWKVARDSLGDQATELMNSWRAAQEKLLRQDQLPDHLRDFWHLTAAALDDALARLKQNNAVFRSKLMQTRMSLPVPAKIGKVLQGLRAQGQRTVLMADASASMVTAMINRSGLRSVIDHLLSSNDIENFRPRAPVYAKLCEKLKLPAEQICYISAEMDDVQAAQASGLQVLALELPGATLHHPMKVELDKLPDFLGVRDVV